MISANPTRDLTYTDDGPMPATAAHLASSPSPKKWGGARPGAGKKKGTRHTANPKIGKRILLNEAQWAYLACWFPSDNPSDQAHALLVDRVMYSPGGQRKPGFWPRGPRTNPRMTEDQLARNAGPSPKSIARAAAELGPYTGRKVYLTADQWAYLALWHPGNESHQFRALLSQAEALWPTGPFTNPRMTLEQLDTYAGG